MANLFLMEFVKYKSIQFDFHENVFKVELNIVYLCSVTNVTSIMLRLGFFHELLLRLFF